jgi:hypothetical protein
VLAERADVQLFMEHEIHISSVSDYLCHGLFSPC